MISRIYSACPQGVEAVPITVEADVRTGNLRISIVGLPDTATRESKDRLIPAITNSGYALQGDEIVINLSPADLRKEGTAYDLSMALAILAARGILPAESTQDTMVVGELALDGSVRPVCAVLAVAECARKHGFKKLIVPAANGPEAALVSNLAVYPVENLTHLAKVLRGRESQEPLPKQPITTQLTQQPRYDLRDVKGQVVVKRVLEIAAAGQHNLLMVGPPGSGKSMLGKRLPGLLPPLTEAELLEVMRIAGTVNPPHSGAGTLRGRPYRAPHHTASQVAIIGGGTHPKPGEVTRAHRGVLFLDEFPEFPRRVLEVLRQPLEDHQVTVSRANQQITFPANFLLVAAMNPCPCGWLGHSRNHCGCTQLSIKQYRARLSGPLLDRIDLHVEVPAIPLTTLRKLPPSESSASVRERVTAAREIQRTRFGSSLVTNGSMSAKQLRRFATLDDHLADDLARRIEAQGCSARVHDKIIKVARTIADLAQRTHINKDDLLEALAYRQFDDQPLAQHYQHAEEAAS